MRYTFQHQIATGRITFPVAVLISIALWVLPFENKTELLTLAAGGLTTYMLIELNTTFALIRTRTEMPSALFLCLYSSLLFLHPYQNTCWIQVFLMGILFGLYNSYESTKSSVAIFHTFLALGLASLIVGDLLWMAPLLYLSMIGLRSFCMRNFFAGLIGLMLPYWLLLGYDLFFEILPFEGFQNFDAYGLMAENLTQIIPFGLTLESVKAEYQALEPVRLISYGIILLISLVGSFLAKSHAYNDKVRTRSFIGAIMPLEIGTIVLVLVHPALMDALLPIQLIFASLTCSYLFALVFTRFVCYFLVTVMGLTGVMIFLNLWMHFFSF